MPYSENPRIIIHLAYSVCHLHYANQPNSTHTCQFRFCIIYAKKINQTRITNRHFRAKFRSKRAFSFIYCHPQMSNRQLFY